MVPQRYQANPQLGTWVHTQRRQYKLLSDGKKSSMTQDKISALDALGFIWVARKNDGDAWSDDDSESQKKPSAEGQEGAKKEETKAEADGVTSEITKVTGEITEKTGEITEV